MLYSLRNPINRWGTVLLLDFQHLHWNMQRWNKPSNMNFWKTLKRVGLPFVQISYIGKPPISSLCAALFANAHHLFPGRSGHCHFLSFACIDAVSLRNSALPYVISMVVWWPVASVPTGNAPILHLCLWPTSPLQRSRPDGRARPRRRTPQLAALEVWLLPGRRQRFDFEKFNMAAILLRLLGPLCALLVVVKDWENVPFSLCRANQCFTCWSVWREFDLSNDKMFENTDEAINKTLRAPLAVPEKNTKHQYQ